MNGNVVPEMQAWQAYKRYVRMKMNRRRSNTPGSNAEFLGDEISAQLFAEWQPLYRKRIGLSRVQRERAKLH